MALPTLIVAALFATSVFSTPLVDRAAPTVQLDNATVTGVTVGSVSNFLGIPFAKPPTGDRRFRLPEAIDPYTSSFTARAIGPSCPQQPINIPLLDGLAGVSVDWLVNTMYFSVLPDAEDCLSVNVVIPEDTKAGDMLPVVAWIYGGGFEIGGDQYYPGGTIVQKSISIGSPVVYVSFNYRVAGFGFMPGKEIKAAGVGNLGLQDQREALRWIQKYISNFGGDPTKVTIFGDSAGAISVALQMLANDGNTEGLFRAGFMASGSPIPTGDITNGQVYYDDVVKNSGCSSAPDTLQCLREVDYDMLKGVINMVPGIFTYQSLASAFLPRTDGVFLKDDAQKLVARGSVARIPIVNGVKDDEGTLFILSCVNITMDTELREYIRTYWLQNATDATLDELLKQYPEDPSQGSPYNTGAFNQLSPQSKRIASFIGDAFFQAPRRYFLEQLADKQDVWSYNNKRLKSLPVFGAGHATDILDLYGGGDVTAYLIQFAASLNPNTGKAGLANWPKYTTADKSLMTFNDLFTLGSEKDDWRTDSIAFLTKVSLDHPW